MEVAGRISPSKVLRRYITRLSRGSTPNEATETWMTNPERIRTLSVEDNLPALRLEITAIPRLGGMGVARREIERRRKAKKFNSDRMTREIGSKRPGAQVERVRNDGKRNVLLNRPKGLPFLPLQPLRQQLGIC